MSKIGVLECFFGPPWSMAQRIEWAKFMQQYQMSFYIYAPKADGLLRKQWRSDWNAAYLDQLRALGHEFQSRSIKFGLGLSPFEFQSGDEPVLRKKLRELNSLNLDYLGIFFDDMNYSEKMLNDQMLTLEVVAAESKAKLIFCPSYYSYDPILDKVFGQRPANYLSEVGKLVPEAIDILWTGPKVISPEISAGHLEEVSQILGRQPFLCDNFFANDGPKQCKYLKLKPSTGRLPSALESSAGWAFNPMNQSSLSQIVVLGAHFGFAGKENAYSNALRAMCTEELAQFIEATPELTQNLDQMDPEAKQRLSKKLALWNEPVAKEIADWLQGKYNVGSECLTD